MKQRISVMILAALAAAVLCVLTPPLQAAQELRTALVIGNGAYSESPLRNPVNDATEMAAALRDLGFAVTLRTDAHQRSMEEAIREFGRRLTAGGVGLFYFAGHGIQYQGRNYLIPVKAEIKSEADVKYEAVDAGRVLAQMEAAGNGLNIIILDACRNNPFARSFRSSEQGLAKMDAPTGSILAYATAPGSVAADGSGKNGLYTENLLKHMRTPGISIERMFKLVRQDVTGGSHKQQVPWESSSLIGDFYFVPARAISVKERPSATPAQSSPTLAVGTRPAAGQRQNDLGMTFAAIPAGSFTMGSPPGEPGRGGDETQHRVTLTTGFFLQTTEVTQGQWRALMGTNPSKFQHCGDACPVEQVSWNDVQAFIQKLNQKTGERYRLPTEAEWEYAARSGSGAALYTGDITIRGKNDAPELEDIAWYGGNSCVSYPGGYDCSGWKERPSSCGACGPHPVGRKAPNAFGLYDMMGNVWEWVQDHLGDYPKVAVSDPRGPAGGAARVYRGGSWYDDARFCRSAFRYQSAPEHRVSNVGFRLALDK